MVNAVMKIEKFNICNFVVDVAVSFEVESYVETPRVAIIFDSMVGNRRVPMKTRIEGNRIIAEGSYDCACVFYKKTPKRVNISFVFSDGTDTGKVYETDLFVDGIKKHPISHFINSSKREKVKTCISVALNVASVPFRLQKVKHNRVSFFTNRTDSPTGNLKAVYNAVSKIDDLDIHVVCKSGGAVASIPVLFKFLHLYMTSKVVFVDDYYHLLSYVNKREETKLVQLWHGCGAFKTIGFSRFHKTSVLELYSANHRQYDVALVSSPEIQDFYAEAFGISREKVQALGSPRCDVLTSKKYQRKITNKFYKKYPELKDKKLLLFAPTFRGKGNSDCYYPTERFDVDKVLDTLGDDWAVLVKLHPYLKESFTCSDRNRDRMINCFDSDVNDILIVSDFLVTDYSSVIFEASILDKPMAFLTFDLDEFIATRDFYYDFKSFVPGPIVETDVEAAQIAKQGDYDLERVRKFKQVAFGDTLGNACNNLKELTINLLKS